MKKQAMIAAVVAAGAVGVAGGFGGYLLGKRQAAPQPAQAADGRKPLYWHDPMVPGQKFDKPGKSPYMDMQLVAVYADEGADAGAVAISPRVQQNLGVRTALVASGTLPLAVSAVGSVAFDERAVAEVQARANGFVERVLVRSPQEQVRRGQPLAEVFMPEWVAAQEEFLAVRRMQSATPALLDAARQRMRLAGMSEQQMRQIESGGRVQARQVLMAPRGGVVTELAAREGMTVAPGSPLYRINGLETVWVNAELPEAVVAQVQAGSPVTARAAAAPDAELRGKVDAILPQVDPATRTIRARIALANPGARLAPGMFVTLLFAPRSGPAALLVPSEAVIRTGARNVVMVEEGAGKFVSAQVELGAEAGGQVEVRTGLKEGQKVAVSGQFLLDSEASLKGSTARMEGAAPATHRGEATVEAVGPGEITLSHGPIATLKWPAMTMTFKLPPGGLPLQAVPGDRVSFEFAQQPDGSFQVTAMAPASATAGAGARAPAAEAAHQHGEHK